MKKLLLFLFLLPAFCKAQLPFFNKVYFDGTLLNNTISLSDGYITLGTLPVGAGNREILLMRLNLQGDKIWSKVLTQEPSAYFPTKLKLVTNALYITGAYMPDGSQSNYDYFLMKVDLDGNIIWNKTFGTTQYYEVVYGIQATQDGGFILCGEGTITGGQKKLYAIKTDSLGNVEWQRGYGNSPSYGYTVVTTPDGGYLFGGHSAGYSSTYDGLLVKTDAQGNEQWQQVVDFGQNEFKPRITALRDGNYAYTLNYFLSSDPNSTVANLIKIDPQGIQVWRTSIPIPFSGGYTDYTTAPLENIDGTLAMTGYISSTDDDPIAFIHKTDAQGAAIWTKQYHQRDDASNYLYDIQSTSDNGYVMCGSTYPVGSNMQHAWMVKLDCGGCDSIQCHTPDSVCQAITSVQPGIEHQSSFTFTLQPNPADQYLVAHFADIEARMLQVYNALGQVVHTAYPRFSERNSITITTSNYHEGVYLAVLIDKKGKRYTQRFVVNR